jgi:hypothetical protein
MVCDMITSIIKSISIVIIVELTKMYIKNVCKRKYNRLLKKW